MKSSSQKERLEILAAPTQILQLILPDFHLFYYYYYYYYDIYCSISKSMQSYIWFFSGIICKL